MPKWTTYEHKTSYLLFIMISADPQDPLHEPLRVLWVPRLRTYSVFQGFRQAKSANGASILSLSQFLILPQLPQKMKLASKVVKVVQSSRYLRSKSLKLTVLLGATLWCLTINSFSNNFKFQNSKLNTYLNNNSYIFNSTQMGAERVQKVSSFIWMVPYRIILLLIRTTIIKHSWLELRLSPSFTTRVSNRRPEGYIWPARCIYAAREHPKNW